MAIDNRIVGANISKLRNSKGMTQFQLAAALNVSHQAVSKWETGGALPDVQTLLALTQLFGVSMEVLLNREIEIEEETAETDRAAGFSRFFSDLIPEEAKKAVKNAADDAGKTIIEITGNLSSRAGETLEKAVQYARKVGEDLEIRIKNAKADEEKPENAEAADCSEPQAGSEEIHEEEGGFKAGSEDNERVNARFRFEQLKKMAPFMSREKLSDLVLRFAEVNDWESIIEIAPFLSRTTVQTLIDRLITRKADRRVICRLAPFAGADALYRLILDNLDEIDWKTVESLAPFLRRNMVDALAEYMICGVLPPECEREAEPEAGSKKTDKKIKDVFQELSGEIQSAVDGVMGEIGSVMGEIQGVMGGLFRKPDAQEAACGDEEADFREEAQDVEEQAVKAEEGEDKKASLPEEEAPPAPDGEAEQPDDAAKEAQTLENTARYALSNGSWTWLKEHAGDVKDPGLSFEIASAAVSSVADSDGAGILLKCIPNLTQSDKTALFQKIADEEAWETAVALQPFAGEEEAALMVKKAAGAQGAQREYAYLAIECYARIAPKEVVAAITEEAIQNDNWVLINALTDLL